MVKRIESIKNVQSINQLISFEDFNGMNRTIYLENNDTLYLNSSIKLYDEDLFDIKEEDTLCLDDMLYIVPSTCKTRTLINIPHLNLPQRIQNILGTLYCPNKVNLSKLKNYDYVVTSEFSNLFSEFGIKQIIVNKDNDFYLKKANEIYVNNINNLSLKELNKKYEINYRVIDCTENTLTFKTFSKLFSKDVIDDFYVKEIDINNNEVIYKGVEFSHNKFKVNLYFEKIKEIECIFYQNNIQVVGKIRVVGSERLFQKL